jgi:hypothetical protein
MPHFALGDSNKSSVHTNGNKSILRLPVGVPVSKGQVMAKPHSRTGTATGVTMPARSVKFGIASQTE